MDPRNGALQLDGLRPAREAPTKVHADLLFGLGSHSITLNVGLDQCFEIRAVAANPSGCGVGRG
jgi:hypothetical protein